MMRAHSYVKRDRAGIGLDRHPGGTEVMRPRRCPFEQQATNSRAQQGRFDKQLEKVCVRTCDPDLNEANHRSIAFGHLKAGGLKLVGMNSQFSPTSRQEGRVISPMRLRAEA
ncbi:MAG: hypothetical protein Q7J60_14880 [Bradyrhizobium sp.]|nr:hypothetical protein [Bradyrhizobium sp.]